LLAAAATSDAAELAGSNEFGHRYTLRVRITTMKGAATMHSGWIILWAEDFSRLTTCYIMRRR
jgi:hypothetical protein